MTAPAVGAAAPPSVRVRRVWQARFGGIEPRDRWGYAVWGSAGVAIAIPEIWSAITTPGWKTISETVGHLEWHWNAVAIIVVAVIAIVAAHAVRFSLPRDPKIVKQADGKTLGRTPGGRFTRSPDEADAFPFWYLPVAFVSVIVPSALVAVLSSDQWVLGYVMYGLIATFAVTIPSLLAFAVKKDVPFSTLARTIADLEHRSHLVAMVIIAGLAVLLIHLSLYPWPDIFKAHPTFGAP
jgi:hypothetical protein